MRVAIVHDWLYTLGGAERVLGELLKMYPGAHVFTLFDVLTDEQRASLGITEVQRSFLARIPGIARSHRTFLPLMPLAIEQLDVSSYDLVISSSSAVAKGIVTGPDQLHIAYLHSPMRYVWDLQHRYLSEMGGRMGVKRSLARLLFHRIRVWDAASSLRPDVLLANSAFVARRITKTCGRDAMVVYPPVDVTPRADGVQKADYFLVAGRMVPYKNTSAVIKAFEFLPELSLVVAGTGPEERKLRQMAGRNVRFTGFVDDLEMRRLMASARALIFAAEEDFGIVPLEAQAEGTPVIALGRGGAKETIAWSEAEPTGLFFPEATPENIAASVNCLLAREAEFKSMACRRNARRFSAEAFRSKFKRVVEERQRAAKMIAPDKARVSMIAAAAE